MPLEARLITGLAISLALVYWATPLAIRVAHRFDFYDRPVGYKGHAAPTPYLGGAAVIVGLLAATILLTSDAERTVPFALGVLVLWLVGTVDDRRHLSPVHRIAVEGGIGVAFWALGLGWSLGLGSGVDLAVTCLWLIAVVNAFNLFDNLDGAASTMALVVSAGVAVLGLAHGDTWLTVTAAALCGACLGFLPHNLALPGARIFLGDGGSMPVGFAAATLVMFGASTAAAEWQALVMGVLLVGVPALDSVLVVVTRRRRGVSILTGGRDHLTHRTLERVRTARAVALALGSGQALLSAFALVAVNGGSLFLVTVVAVYLAGVLTAITVLDAPAAAGPAPAAESATSTTRPPRRPRGAWTAVALAPLGTAFALSPFASGFYDSDLWAPAGIGLILVLTVVLVARPASPSRPALAAIGALGALSAWALLSATWGDSIEQAVLEANRLAVYAVALALMVALTGGRRARVALLGAIGVGTVVVAAVVVGKLLSGDDSLLLAGRLHEPLEYINAQGGFFLLAMWPALALAEQRGSRWLAALGLGAATLFASLGVLTQSRGVVLAAAVSIVVVMAFVPGRLRRAVALLVVAVSLAPALPALANVYDEGSAGPYAEHTLRNAGIAALFAATAAAAIWFASVSFVAGLGARSSRRFVRAQEATVLGLGALGVVALVVGLASAPAITRYVDRQYDSFVSLGASEADSDGSRLASGAGTRHDYWRIAVRTWGDNKLAGVGAGGYDRPYFRERRTTEDVRQPHSIELQMLAELGIVGAALLAAFLVAIALAARRHIVVGRESRASVPLVTASLGLVVAWLAHTSVDWLHLLPGVTGMALAGAAILLARPASGEPETAGRPAWTERPPAVRVAVVLAVALPLMLAALSLSRQALAEHYRAEAQEALADDPARALREANRSLRIDAEALPTYYVKAAAFARFGDGSAAERVLLAAVFKEREDFVTWALLGDLAVRRQAFDRAKYYYGRAHDLNPRDPGLATLARDPSEARRQLSNGG